MSGFGWVAVIAGAWLVLAAVVGVVGGWVIRRSDRGPSSSARSEQGKTDD